MQDGSIGDGQEQPARSKSETRLTGVVSGDDVTCTGGTAAFARDYVDSWIVTATGLGLSGADAGNYTVNSTATGYASITKRPITIRADGQTKLYGTTLTFAGTEFSISKGSLVEGDTISQVTLTSAGAPADAPVNGSPYPIIPSAAVFSGYASDYQIGYANGTLTVVGQVQFPFTGFFAPVDNPPVVNVASAGRSIPFKFSLGDDRGLEILAVGYRQVQLVQCEAGPADAIETYSSGSGLSYDPQTQQYVYIWKTQKSWAGKCGTFVMVLVDGTTHTAEFKFKSAPAAQNGSTSLLDTWCSRRSAAQVTRSGRLLCK